MQKNTKQLSILLLLIIGVFLLSNISRVSADNTPYTGGPYAIPGTIQAENFDNGGEGVAYHDSTQGSVLGGYRADESVDMLNADGGISVGWTTDGEWLKYTVNVATAGMYTISTRTATPNSGKSLGVDIDGANVATINIPNTTGFQSYQTTTGSDVTLTAGTHVLKLTMNTGSVDNPNLGFDVNSITFTTSNNPPPPPTNQPPISNAGSDQTITLPTNFVTFAGSVTDPEKGPMTYLWTKISGPTDGVITSPTNLNTTVTSLTAGTYVFWLTATDNGGMTNADAVTVIVNPSLTPTNQLPVAIAGPHQRITLPTSFVMLSGSATDSDGQVTSYAWTQVSGATAIIDSPTSASTYVHGFAQGQYIFRLTATDDKGGKGTSDIIVNVAANPNPSTGGTSSTPVNNSQTTTPITQTPTTPVTQTPIITPTYTPTINTPDPSITIPLTGIRKGSSKENIKNLQRFLNWNFGTKLAPLTVDGKWGYRTTLAIKLFQEANNLKADGVFGRGSATKANELLGNGEY